jgi:hypothetical protein
VARSIDHSAVLLPGEERRSTRPTQPTRWGRFFVGFFYVLATGCAIVLLVLSWRNEVDRRQAAEARASESVSSLAAANEKLQTLEDANATLSTRVKKLDGAATKAHKSLDRRTRVLREVRALLVTTEDFVAALDGLDEVVGDTVKAETALRVPESRLDRRITALDRYLRTTDEKDLDRTVLRARVRALAKELEHLQSVIATLVAGKDDLDKSVEPLGKTEELDRALKATLARAKAALRR